MLRSKIAAVIFAASLMVPCMTMANNNNSNNTNANNAGQNNNSTNFNADTIKNFTNRANNRFNQENKVISQLKNEREKVAKNSPQYLDLTERIARMSGLITQGRDEVDSLNNLKDIMGSVPNTLMKNVDRTLTQLDELATQQGEIQGQGQGQQQPAE